MDTRYLSPSCKEVRQEVEWKQPESESVIEEVAQDLLFPRCEVGTVGGRLQGEEDVALVQGSHLRDRHSLLVEQIPRME